MTPSGGTPNPAAASDTGSSSTDNITAATAPTFTVALNPSVAAGDTVQLLLDGSPLAHPVTHVITAADLKAGSASSYGDRGRPRGRWQQASRGAVQRCGRQQLDNIGAELHAGHHSACSGDNQRGRPDQQAAPTITGSVDVADAGASVTILDGITAVGNAIVQSDGSWSSSVILSNGSNSLTAQVTDLAGNTASSAPIVYTLSTTGPSVTEQLTIDSGSSATDHITSNDALTGTGLANTVVHFTIDGSAIASTVIADSQGAWSFTPTGLADGPHTVVASQTDTFGNTGTASLSFTLDSHQSAA